MAASPQTSHLPAPAATALAVTLLLVLLAALPATAAAASYRWAQPSMNFVRGNGLVPPANLQAGAGASMTRGAFVQALAELDRQRAAKAGAPAQMASAGAGSGMRDAAPGSLGARAVGLGWMVPVNGRFAAEAPITADEAARGVVGALGLRRSTAAFARRLRAEVPGVRTNHYLRASQVYVRALGMRYNHLQGTEQLEVGPTEAMSTAHVAYMLHRAATAEDWRLQSLVAYETFDVPALGKNQRTVLAAGVSMLGQPYVWGGETEGAQPEGHGGFDCSGFVWRTVLNGGVPADQVLQLTQRTSFDMSAIPKARRIRSAAALRPGDLLFFGTRGPRSKPAENYHAGLYMGNGWMIHSSGGNGGPTIQRLDGYWKEHFSWGRRVLRTA